jgi:hypothetical protein
LACEDALRYNASYETSFQIIQKVDIIYSVKKPHTWYTSHIIKINIKTSILSVLQAIQSPPSAT